LYFVIFFDYLFLGKAATPMKRKKWWSAVAAQVWRVDQIENAGGMSQGRDCICIGSNCQCGYMSAIGSD